MPRLFTGLAIPPGPSEQLAFLCGGMSDARWVDPHDFHITLCFLGDIGHALAADAVEVLRTLHKPALEIEIEGLDAFGGNRPRSLYARVVPSPELLELQSAQEKALRRIGVQLEARQFTPHVTLAWLGRRTTAAAVADWLSLRILLRQAFLVTEVHLLSSRESTGGGPYLVEEAFDLD